MLKINDAEKFLVKLKNSLQDVEEELVNTQGKTHEVIENIKKNKLQLAKLDKEDSC